MLIAVVSIGLSGYAILPVAVVHADQNRQDPGTSGHSLHLPDAAGTPTWAPDESWLAYRVDDAGYSFRNKSLRVVSSDGSGTVSLGRAIEPLWYEGESVSPSGRHIAYGLNEEDKPWGPYDLWLLTVDGRDRRKVVSDVHSHGWSPDGTQLAFGTGEFEDEDLWILPVGRAVGTPIRVATGVHEWKWSPDGKQIAYTSVTSTIGTLPYPQTLWVTTRAGPPRQLAAGRIEKWEWSPDNRRLAYEISRDDLWTVPVSGSPEVPGAGPVRLIQGAQDWGWSPDGALMLYFIQVKAASRGITHMWVASQDGASHKWLASNVISYDVAWSPAGDRLAYIVDDGGDDGSQIDWGADDGDLWVYALADGEREWVAGDVSRFDWSSDSRMLAYSNTGPAVDRYHGVYAPAPLWVWRVGTDEPDILVAERVKYSRWSPDSTGIAYWKWPEGSSAYDADAGELWMWSESTNAVGKVASNVHTGQPENTSGISIGRLSWGWSPRGTYLAYRAADSGVFVVETATVELEEIDTAVVGDARTTGIEVPGPEEKWPKLAAIPYRIGFFEQPGPRTSRVFIMNTDGSDQRQLTYGYSEHPSWSPDGRHIAFTGSVEDPDNGSWIMRQPLSADYVTEIFVAPADGGNQVQLTDLKGWSRAPRWSPDGSHIAFIRNDGSHREIMLMASDGTEVRHFAYGSDPAWAPDGVRLAYTRIGDMGRSEVVVVDIQSGDELGIAEGAAPVWSPDGSRMAVLRGIENEIILVDTRTMDEKRFAAAGAGSDWVPAWSPDGAWIAYTTVEAGIDFWNVEIRLGGVTEDPPPEHYRIASDGFGASWSPEGTHVAFGRYFEGYARSNLAEILVADVFDGGHEPRLTTDDIHYGYREGSTSPAWSPDGAKIAFTSDRPPEGRLVATKADGSERKVLARIGAHDREFAWSSDRSRVAFSRYQSANDSQSDIYVIDRDGSNLRRVSSIIYGESRQPRWSPTGTRLAFVASGLEYNEGIYLHKEGIYVVNHDGTGERELIVHDLSSARGEGTRVDIGGPAWSPDGTRVAANRFVSSSEEGSSLTQEILFVDVDSGRQRIVFDRDKEETSIRRTVPSWSPDGTKLAFEIEGTLFVATVDGVEVYELLAPDGLGDLQWAPDSMSIAVVLEIQDEAGLFIVEVDVAGEPTKVYEGSVRQPRWSPDGSCILFENGVGSIGIVSVDGEFMGWVPGDKYNRAYSPVWLDN